MDSKQDMEERQIVYRRKKRLVELYNAGHYDKAIGEYRALLETQLPSNQEAKVMRHLAQSYFQASEYANAINASWTSLEVNPHDEKTYLIGIKAAGAAKDKETLRRFVAKSMEYHPNSKKINDAQRDAFPDENPADEIGFEQLPDLVEIGTCTTDTQIKQASWTSLEVNPRDEKTYIIGLEAAGAAMDEKTLPSFVAKSMECVPNSSKINDAQRDAPSDENPADKIGLEQLPDLVEIGTCTIDTQIKQKYRDLCVSATNAIQNGRPTLNQFIEIHSILIQLPDLVSETEVLVVRFLLANEKLKTRHYYRISDAIPCLKHIESAHARTLPAVYPSLVKAFIHTNRWKLGYEWAIKGQKFMASGFKFTHQCYPQTNTVIPETTRRVIVKELDEFAAMLESRAFHERDAVCRFGSCQEVNYQRIVPSKDIFFSDPDFDGYIYWECSDKCRMHYHRMCWKQLKLILEMSVNDSDVVGKPCFTPSCYGTLSLYQRHDAKRRLQSEYSISGDKFKKRRHSTPNVTKKFVKTQNSRKRDSTPKKLSEKPMTSKTPPASPLKFSTSPLNAQNNSPVVLRTIGTRAAVPTIQFKDPYQSYQGIAFPETHVDYEIVATDEPFMFHDFEIFSSSSSDDIPQVTLKDKCTQTTKPTSCRETQTTPDKTKIKLEELSKTMEKERAASSKKYEKLREKYLALKNRESELEKDVIEVRNEERTKTYNLWNHAGETMIDFWLKYATEKDDVMQQTLQASTDDRMKIILEKSLREWKQAKDQFSEVHDDFLKEVEMAPNAHTTFKLPQLPTFPKEVYPVHQIINVLANYIRGLEAEIHTLKMAVPPLMAPPPPPPPFHNGTEVMYIPPYQPHNIARPQTAIPHPLPADLTATSPTPPKAVLETDSKTISASCNNPTLNEFVQTTNIPDTTNKYVLDTPIERGEPSNSNFGESASHMIADTIESNTPDGSSQIEPSIPVRNKFEQLSEDNKLNGSLIRSKSLKDITSSKLTLNSSVAMSLESLAVNENIPSDFKPFEANSKRRKKRTVSTCSSVVSEDSFEASSGNKTKKSEHLPAENNRYSVQSPTLPGVYYKLIEYLSKHFPLKSEEELVRSLEKVRSDNYAAFTELSLDNILSEVKSNLSRMPFSSKLLQHVTKPLPVPVKPILNYTDCPICLEPLSGNLTKLKCSHVFHPKCLTPWLFAEHSCPMCREHVISEEEFPPLT